MTFEDWATVTIPSPGQCLRHRSTAEKWDNESMRAAKRGNVSDLCTTF